MLRAIEDTTNRGRPGRRDTLSLYARPFQHGTVPTLGGQPSSLCKTVATVVATKRTPCAMTSDRTSLLTCSQSQGLPALACTRLQHWPKKRTPNEHPPSLKMWWSHGADIQTPVAPTVYCALRGNDRPPVPSDSGLRLRPGWDRGALIGWLAVMCGRTVWAPSRQNLVLPPTQLLNFPSTTLLRHA